MGCEHTFILTEFRDLYVMYDQLACFYDLTHANLVEDVDLILHLAERVEGAILELGCGTGRLIKPLARAGHDIVGVDNSPAMLALARNYLLRESVEVQRRVRLVEQDFTTLHLADGEAFEFALVPYNTFLHLDDRGKRAALRRVRSYLGENGRLFIDLINPFLLAGLAPDDRYVLEGELVDPTTQQTVQQFSRAEPVVGEQIVRVHWLYREGEGETGGETAVSVNYHYLYPHELDLLCQQTGFQMQAIWGDYDQRAFTQTSPRLLLLIAPKAI